MLTALVAFMLSQSAPELAAARAANQASYEKALEALVASKRLKRHPLELASSAGETRAGFQNVKLRPWHGPAEPEVVPQGPALVEDRRGVLHLVWPEPQSVATVVVEAPASAPPPGPPPMQDLRVLVPASLDLGRLGPDLTVRFKATTLERRAAK